MERDADPTLCVSGLEEPSSAERAWSAVDEARRTVRGVGDAALRPLAFRFPPPWRVFLSHTSELRDQPSERSFVNAAESAVIRAGHAVADMAYMPARDADPAKVCVLMVASADVYVGIVGLRYGALVGGRSRLSFTELEFRTATELRLPRLMFLLRENAQDLLGGHTLPAPDPRQEAFRSRLLDGGETTIAWVTSPLELELRLYQSLVELWKDEMTARFDQALRHLTQPAPLEAN